MVEDLSGTQVTAIAALMSTPTVAGAARKAGVSPDTLWLWLRDPVFQSAYRATRRAAVEEAVSALQRASVEAVATLERLLKCGKPTVEVRAATGIIDRAVKGVETLDLEARIAALEEL